MKRISFALLAVFLALGLVVSAKDASGPVPYFASASLDAKSILPPPPANDSGLVEKELETILQKQASRTEQDVARIKAEQNYDVYVFGDAAIPWFTGQNESNFPLTAQLLKRVTATVEPIATAAPEAWKRPRPFLINSRVYPAIERPKDWAYPGGHATRATVDALVLSALMPDLQGPLMMRAGQIGDDRVIAGVNYPSDTDAGRRLAQAMFTKIQSSAGFSDELRQARLEIAALRKKQGPL